MARRVLTSISGIRKFGNALSAAVRATAIDPLAWLEQDEIYDNLRQSEGFCQAFTAALESVKDGGALATIRAYLKQTA